MEPDDRNPEDEAPPDSGESAAPETHAQEAASPANATPARASELRSWREAAREIAQAIRAEPRVGLCWLLPMALILLHQETVILGGSSGGSGLSGVLLLALAGGGFALLLARLPEVAAREALLRSWWCGLGVTALWIGLGANRHVDALLVRPRPWRWLLLPLLFVSVAGLASRKELRRLLSQRSGDRRLALLPACLAVWVIVCAAEGLAHPPGADGLQAVPLALNVWVGLVPCALFYALSARPWLAAGCGALVLSLLYVCNAVKLHFLRAPLSVFDLQYVAEFNRLQLLGGLGIAGLVLFLLAGLYGLWRTPREPLGWAPRLGLVLTGLLTIGFLSTSFTHEPSRRALASLGVFVRTAEARRSTLANGLLLELALEAHSLSISPPAGYGAERVEAALARNAPGPISPVASATTPAPTVVVWLMEAFCDPLALGFKLSEDPIPVFRGLQGWQGEAVSPVFGGLSANAEFEVLTGLSLALLPRDSCPYRQYVHGPLPALPSLLRDQGYRTRALHSETLDYYDYRRVYPLLGFDGCETLWQKPGVELDLSERRPSDTALARLLLEHARKPGPAFLFAFPNQAHWPWSPTFVRRNRIRVLTPLPAKAKAEVEGYVNALREADRALGVLVEGLASLDRPAVLLAMGDHLPALPSAAYDATGPSLDYEIDSGQFDLGGGIESVQRCFTVPVRIWSSAKLPPRPAFRYSTNYLSGLVLEAAGRPENRLATFLRGVRGRLPVVGRYLQSAGGPAHLPGQSTPAEREILEDYRHVQHDLLFGAGHAR